VVLEDRKRKQRNHITKKINIRRRDIGTNLRKGMLCSIQLYNIANNVEEQDARSYDAEGYSVKAQYDESEFRVS
jgi:hypothetical protein